MKDYRAGKLSHFDFYGHYLQIINLSKNLDKDVRRRVKVDTTLMKCDRVASLKSRCFRLRLTELKGDDVDKPVLFRFCLTPQMCSAPALK